MNHQPRGWSDIVSIVATRDQAVATIGLFVALRDTIGAPLSWWRCEAERLPDMTAEDWKRVEARDFSVASRSELLMRSLKPIALDPSKRADTLLALDVHITYLRAQFGISEGDA